MQPLLGRGMGVVGPWSLSRGDPSALRFKRASCAQLLRSVRGATYWYCWFAWSSWPIWSVCVYETGLLLLFAYVSLMLLPLSFFLGVGAPSLWMLKQTISLWYSRRSSSHSSSWGLSCSTFQRAILILLYVLYLLYRAVPQIRRYVRAN